MRLYHRLSRRKFSAFWKSLFLAWGFAFSLLLSGCASPQVSQRQINVQITADGQIQEIRLAAGSTAQEAFDQAGITLTALDQSDPPLYTVLGDGAEIILVRVTEEFEIEQVVIPFEHQMVQSESLPVGEERLSQPGENGLQEITYRRVLEDGVEVSRAIVKSTIVKEAVPEIIMVGSQTPFASLPIPGRLVYLSAGNAWVMDRTTGNRRPVVTTGDLDGRIFNLSANGAWLLFTRHTDDDEAINTLWAARMEENADLLVDLKTANIVHFASWGPYSNNLAYSTVEPRPTAPGWQANNDLGLLGLSSSGFVTQPDELLEANSGGVYGWWGMDFAWAPDGKRLAYARPDGIGLFSLEERLLSPLLEITPLQTGSDWAWVPGIAWSPDGKSLFTVSHAAPSGAVAPEESPNFDLTVIPLEGGPPVRLASQVGMFAYPVPSPLQVPAGTGESQTTAGTYQVAYLQAVFPSQSESSRYRLVVMDRDGSNRRVLFPPEGAPGLEPQQVAWSPTTLGEENSYVIAVTYQGNIWLVSLLNGQSQQITGDGLTSRIDWR